MPVKRRHKICVSVKRTGGKSKKTNRNAYFDPISGNINMTFVRGAVGVSVNPTSNNVSEPQIEMMPDELGFPPDSSYISAKKLADTEWRTTRDERNSTFLKSMVYENEYCDCGNPNAPYRCYDCGIMTMCESCVTAVHAKVKLHLPLKWNDVCYEDYCVDQLFIFTTYHRNNCNTTYSRRLNVIDDQGRLHRQCKFNFCTCVCETTQLYTMNMWPNSSINAEIVFDVSLLRLLQSMQIEAKASLFGMCSAFKWVRKHNWLYDVDIYRALSNFESFEEFKYTEHALKMMYADNGTTCPCCYKNSTKIFVLDGNFAAVHKRSASKCEIGSRYCNSLFLPGNFADEDLKYASVNQGCTNFRAGEYLRSKESAKKLDVQGVFGAVCRHEFWRLMMDMTTGERYCYGVAAIREILSLLPKQHVVFIYDIACKLQRYMEVRPDLCGLLQQASLAIDQFHSYGHTSECQLFKSIRSTTGVGLTCGSQLERQWPPIRRTSPQTKEMSLAHRRDHLSLLMLHENFKRTFNIGYVLSRKMKNADKVVSDCENKINELGKLINVSLTEDIVDQYLALEKVRPTTCSTANKRLSKLIRLRYLAMEREFVLANINRYPIGQKINTRLNRQLKKQVSERQKLLREIDEPMSQEVLNPNSPFFAEIWPADSSVNAPNISRTFRLEAIRLFQLKARATEEKTLVMADARCSIQFFLEQEQELSTASELNHHVRAHVYHRRLTILFCIQKIVSKFPELRCDSIDKLMQSFLSSSSIIETEIDELDSHLDSDGEETDSSSCSSEDDTVLTLL